MDLKFKLSFREPRYIVNNEKKVVTCLIDYHINSSNSGLLNEMYYLSKILWRYKNGMNDNDIFRDDYTATAIARLDPNDVFNEEIGKKISRARAEAEAYDFANRKIQCLYNKFIEVVGNAVTNFDSKTEDVVWHNEQYIRKF